MVKISDRLEPSPGEAPAGGAAMLFREGTSRVAGAVHVVTTDGPAGRAGFTATAVAPVTDAPPTLLVCANIAGRSGQMVEANGVFCVNTLAAGEVALAEAFAGRSSLTGEGRFAIGRWARLATGAPVLETSLVSFECRLLDTRRLGTHDVIIGEVLEVTVGPGGPPLVYFARRYQSL